MGYFDKNGNYHFGENQNWIDRSTRARRPERAKKGYWQERDELKKLLEKPKKQTERRK